MWPDGIRPPLQSTYHSVPTAQPALHFRCASFMCQAHLTAPQHTQHQAGRWCRRQDKQGGRCACVWPLAPFHITWLCPSAMWLGGWIAGSDSEDRFGMISHHAFG